MLDRKAIEELKAIHRREFNRDLTDDEAWEMGNRLLRIFAVLMRVPTPPKQEPPPNDPSLPTP
jgi:hypothetical protein